MKLASLKPKQPNVTASQVGKCLFVPCPVDEQAVPGVRRRKAAVSCRTRLFNHTALRRAKLVQEVGVGKSKIRAKKRAAIRIEDLRTECGHDAADLPAPVFNGALLVWPAGTKISKIG